jgi:hypothetical protein
VPRWWRDFEITYRRGHTTYRLKVENPLGVSRGVATVELDGALQKNDEFNLSDDGQTHIVRVVLGEKAKPDANESEAGKLEPNQENGATGNQTVSETQR